jgi:hypothetical protein
MKLILIITYTFDFSKSYNKKSFGSNLLNIFKIIKPLVWVISKPQRTSKEFIIS